MKNIDHFEIRSELGRGGMATVFLGYDPRFDREVAIKVLPKEFLHDKKFRARFEREAKVIAQLEHPAIVPVYDYGEVDGQPYLVMRYMQGGSLDDRLEKGPMQVGEILNIIERIASALSEAHSQGIIHRDLKPGNIMFDHQNNAYLGDFGIAKLKEATVSFTGSAIIGTPAYMSPEQVHGDKEIDGRSDVYALGIILFEMLTGQKPYKADTPAKLLMAHLLDPVPRVLEAKGDLPPGVDTVTSRALAKEPEQRYSLATDMSKALRIAITSNGHGEPTEKVSPGEQLPEPTVTKKVKIEDDKGKGSLPWKWIITGIIILGLIFGGGPLIKQGQTGEGPLAFLAAETPIPTNVPPADTPIPTQAPTLAPTSPPTSPPTQPPTDEPLPTLGIGSTMESPVDGSLLVYVPEGQFQMGSEDGYEDERPAHMVNLDAFWIGQTEVTNAMFSTFLNAEGNQMEAGGSWLDVDDENAQILWVGGQWKPVSGFGDYLVIEVTWYGAQAYCKWAGGRLPTEAEWEKTARGLDGRDWPWGNQFDSSVVNLDDETNVDEETIACTAFGCDGYRVSAPVGSFPGGASPYGALDMAGNVWEWVLDWYDPEYYPKSPVNNPAGPTSGSVRGVRGGSWLNYELDPLTTLRQWHNPADSTYAIGFRCVFSP